MKPSRRLDQETALAAADRFWAKVDRGGPDECWPWLGSISTMGYGQLGFAAQAIGLTRKGRANIPVLAHRVAYTLEYGAVPEGLLVLHRCDNRRCVNHAHLYAGTDQNNVDDMVDHGNAWWQRKCRPDPGPWRSDDRAWGEFCHGCGKRLKTVSIYSPKMGQSGTHFWAHR